MKRYLKILLFFLLPVLSTAQQSILSHEIFFNKVPPPDGITFGHITGMTQDRNGYMWLSTKKGLCRYDGYEIITYKNNPLDPNSLASNILESVCVDSAGIIWIGTAGAGLERFDPSTGLFKHFRYNPNDTGSISADWVSVVMIDHEGILWAGTGNGLDRYHADTGTFEHFRNKPNDSTSISSDEIIAIYEDKQGSIWIGTGSIYGADKNIKERGGLNRMNKKTGTFTRYMHDPHNPNSLINNKVKAIFEDSKGTFWVGTAGDGLHTMDRENGSFIRHQFDLANPKKLSRPPISQEYPQTDQITFIREDAVGDIWIGTSESGINYYNPKTTKLTHHIDEKDTNGAFAERTAWCAYTSRDGVLWISTLAGNLYRIDLLRKEIPHYELTEGAVHCFYQEPNGILWLGTSDGIARKDPNHTFVPWNHLAKTFSDITGIWTRVIKGDDRGNLWIGGFGGLTKWNEENGELITYLIDPKNKNSLGNIVTAVQQDSNGDLWIGTAMGIGFQDHLTGSSTRYLLNPTDTTVFGQNFITAVLLDKNGRVWVGSMAGSGLNLFDREKGTFQNYLNVYRVNCIFEDGDSVLWVGTNDGLYKYDSGSDTFIRFKNLNTLSEISSVSGIVEDNQHNLWLGTANGIVKIDSRQNETSVYGKNYGVGEIGDWLNSCYKGLHGEIYFGDATGYYVFNPSDLTSNVRPPEIIMTAFSLADQIIKPGHNGPLKESLSEVKEIRLPYDQNIFSFDFVAIDYTNPEANQHLYMLENYDNNWRQANSEHRANYFNIPPGHYIFKIKVANSYGVWTEKNIEVTIMPPWWRTWWAYTIFVILFVAVIWAIIYYRSRQLRRENKILEEKVSHRTAQLQESFENLKSTQAQLIQSEKMASLGELTAGIAHEIQNPLNFVNNFSEVNSELIDEMNQEIDRGNMEEVKFIARDIKENQEKILGHGKRADAIVKGMLQHSRSNNGQKEPTDINALADEYLRLAYHGMRAKDKSFNATMKTDFDPAIGLVNVIPQDIGRVILNLITNAFYAVSEKQKSIQTPYPQEGGVEYMPTVTVKTQKHLPLSGGRGSEESNSFIQISVTDNGTGIPQKVIDKVFQPFFTTKPTGHGTGLGLSLSYDIVKAHGGSLTVESTEGEGTIFRLELPKS